MFVVASRCVVGASSESKTNRENLLFLARLEKIIRPTVEKAAEAKKKLLLFLSLFESFWPKALFSFRKEEEKREKERTMRLNRL